MQRLLVCAFALVFLFGISGTAEAKQCRDATGKFVKCKTPPPAANKKCRDASGKFIKCKTK